MIFIYIFLIGLSFAIVELGHSKQIIVRELKNSETFRRKVGVISGVMLIGMIIIVCWPVVVAEAVYIIRKRD